jgi:hypothetical protein
MNSCLFCNRPCKRKYCSRQCGGKASNGGYREGSGKSKSGYYKGIYCGSTYELCWVIYQLDNNIPFKRFPITLSYENRKYVPDFLQFDKIVEIKGYESPESVAIKTNIANKNGYDVIVLRKDQLVKEFNWVKNNYTYKQVYELYDDYRPKFSYTCENCGNLFSRLRENKSKRMACSRSCSLTLNRKVSGHNQYTK